MVRKERLELSRREALEPKSSVSTNSTTPAKLLSHDCQGRQSVQKKWGGRWGLNPRPPESQSGALPTELRPPLFLYNFTYLNCFCYQSHGASGRIRTCDHPLRRRVLYPAELRTLVESKSKWSVR